MNLFFGVWISLLLSLPFAYVSEAGEILPVLKVESVFPLEISVVEQGVKWEVSVPSNFNTLIGGEYNGVVGLDLNGDGVDEIIITISNGGSTPNSCVVVFFYNRESRQLSQIEFEGESICNLKFQRGYVVSSFRDASAWSEKIYKVEGRASKLFYFDWCVGCDETRRTDYSLEAPTSYLMSNDLEFEKRIPLEYIVTSPKAAVYEGLNDQGWTRKYLVSGDAVRVIGVEQSIDKEWKAEVKFFGRVITSGWMLCRDLGGCTVAQ